LEVRFRDCANTSAAYVLANGVRGRCGPLSEESAARASTQHDTATTENTEAARVTSKALNVSGNMKVDSWKSMLCKLRPTVVSTPPSLSRSIKLSNAMPETAEAEQQTRTPMQCRSASRKANQVQLSPSRKYSRLKICPCLDFGFDQSWRPER
jgi:hypothetical protein